MVPRRVARVGGSIPRNRQTSSSAEFLDAYATLETGVDSVFPRYILGVERVLR
jgi:hypothetical protein